MRSLLLSLLVVTACAPVARAVRPVPDVPLPQITDDTITYDIAGSTAGELRSSLNQLGPTDDSGRHDAYTKWYVRWFYDYDRAENVCRLTNIRATLEVKTTLPRWPAENPDVGPRWQQYLTALRTHEKGHAQNGIDAARFIVAALQQQPAAADCDAAAVSANAKATEELELARARDREYDAETRHGETQGATFR